MALLYNNLEGYTITLSYCRFCFSFLYQWSFNQSCNYVFQYSHFPPLELLSFTFEPNPNKPTDSLHIPWHTAYRCPSSFLGSTWRIKVKPSVQLFRLPSILLLYVCLKLFPLDRFDISIDNCEWDQRYILLLC